MEYTLFTKLAAEFVGTAVLMVFGNGAVANAELKNTKGYHAAESPRDVESSRSPWGMRATPGR